MITKKNFKYEHYYDYYHIVVNGNEFNAADKDKNKCLRKCEKLAEKGIYVELWKYFNPGQRILIDYWN